MNEKEKKKKCQRFSQFITNRFFSVGINCALTVFNPPDAALEWRGVSAISWGAEVVADGRKGKCQGVCVAGVMVCVCVCVCGGFRAGLSLMPRQMIIGIITGFKCQ